VTDETMELVGGLATLQALSLHDTRVTDEGVRRIGRLPELRSLELDGVQLTDEGLLQLAPLEHLVTLSLRDTLVTRRGLERLQSLPSLRSTKILIPRIDTETLEERRLRRQGFTGRLRLAWGAIRKGHSAGVSPIPPRP
jgi:internalin A